MPNSFSYLALFGWPIIVVLLFRLMPRTQALIWSILGGYLALPYAVGIDPPLLPVLDKTLIPSVAAALMCWLGAPDVPVRRPPPAQNPTRNLAQNVVRTRVRSAQAADAEATVPQGPPSRLAFTRQTTRRPVRIAGPVAASLAAPLRGRVPWIIPALIALLVVGQFLTLQQNGAPYLIGGRFFPGLAPYDAFSMVLNVLVMLLPFWLGMLYLGEPEAQVHLLRLFCVAGLIYSLPTLLEIRLSPQLARWTYGFLAQSFAQAMRDGGFRPVVFLQHGLWLAIFLAQSALAGFALWRHEPEPGRKGFALFAALWLSAVLFLCHSLGAFVLLVALAPVVVLKSARGPLVLAAVITALVVTYPMLRGADLVPVQQIEALAASVSNDRADSFKFRLDNEDRLLAHAKEKALAGWGGYGRARVYDPETGEDTSVTDGMWIIIMGDSGWIGYLGTFGLLAVPVLLIFLRRRVLAIEPVTAALCLILGANMIDMMVNATMTPLTWLLAGALAGRCRYAGRPADSGGTEPTPGQQRPAQRGRAGGRRQISAPSLFARMLAIALALGLLASGPSLAQDATDPPAEPSSVAAGSGLTNPLLAFGLSSIADWSTERPFLDLMKEARPFLAHDRKSWDGMTHEALAEGGYLDPQGWPTSIPKGMVSVGTVWDWVGSQTDPKAAASRAGVYILTWRGVGQVTMSGDVKVLHSRSGWMMLQNLHGGSMILNITVTDPKHTGNHIRDLVLVPQKYAALHAAGEIFNPDWLAVVQDARHLRFTDWMETNGKTQASWADRPEVDDATWMQRGVPLEVMVQLANQTGTEPWFNIPAGADDDYIRSFASYVQGHLDPALKVHVEYSNEAWNGGFAQNRWLADQAKAVWGDSDDAARLDFHAMLATKAALIWQKVFGAEAAARLDNVLGTQTANAWLAQRLLTAPLWQSHDAAGYVAPATVFDSLGVTTYFGGATMSDATLRAELLEVLADPARDATAWLKARMEDPGYALSIPQIEAQWAANKAVADTYGLDLVAYEGGQHLLQSFGIAGMSAEEQETLTVFLSGFARSPAMADLYHELWLGWAAVSDGPFMHFVDVAPASKWGAWGLYGALGDAPPRATLLVDLNAHAASWFGDGGGTGYQQGVIRLAGVSKGDTLTGTDKDDFLIGGKGPDVLIPGKGHDAVSGGAGEDVLVLPGTSQDYQLTSEGEGSYRLTGPGTVDILTSIEVLRFADGTTKSPDKMVQN